MPLNPYTATLTENLATIPGGNPPAPNVILPLGKDGVERLRSMAPEMLQGVGEFANQAFMLAVAPDGFAVLGRVAPQLAGAIVAGQGAVVGLTGGVISAVGASAPIVAPLLSQIPYVGPALGSVYGAIGAIAPAVGPILATASTIAGVAGSALGALGATPVQQNPSLDQALGLTARSVNT